MRRREFIAALGGAAAWPMVVRAQQPAMPVIGFLGMGAPRPFAEVTNAFKESLREAGYASGKNINIEFRWAAGQYEQLPRLATDLVQHSAAVIVVAGGAISVLAVKATTSTVPIVFITGADPVKDGLVAGLNRPGGNVTGASLFVAELVAKRLELLAEMVPNATTIGVLVNPANPNAETDAQEAQSAAHTRGRKIVLLNARDAAEIDTAFATIAHLICEVGARLEVIGRLHGGNYDLPVTQSHLADAMGLSLVHVNRTLKQLRDDGLLSFRGHEVTVVDWERLRAAAEFDPGYLQLSLADAPLLGQQG